MGETLEEWKRSGNVGSLGYKYENVCLSASAADEEEEEDEEEDEESDDADGEPRPPAKRHRN